MLAAILCPECSHQGIEFSDQGEFAICPSCHVRLGYAGLARWALKLKNDDLARIFLRRAAELDQLPDLSTMPEIWRIPDVTIPIYAAKAQRSVLRNQPDDAIAIVELMLGGLTLRGEGSYYGSGIKRYFRLDLWNLDFEQ